MSLACITTTRNSIHNQIPSLARTWRLLPAPISTLTWTRNGFPAGSSALNIADQEHNSYAMFGQADYNVTEQFIVTAGLRWTSENKDMTNTFTENPTPAPARIPAVRGNSAQGRCG